jgi:hypothetical protein
LYSALAGAFFSSTSIPHTGSFAIFVHPFPLYAIQHIAAQ